MPAGVSRFTGSKRGDLGEDAAMLSRRRLALATTLVAALGSSALAVQGDHARRARDQEAVALHAAGVSRPLRSHVSYAHHVVPAQRGAAWTRLQAAAPGLTRSSWDRATGVPSRIWGRGIDVPGSVADGAIAAAAARAFLRDHVELIAPGSTASDFELVANVRHGAMRTLGFVQRHAGLRVFGGQVSFRFKHDRLFVVGSEALPEVRVDLPHRFLATGETRSRAAAASALDLGLPLDRVTTGAPGALMIVPLVGEHGVLGYRAAVPVEVDGGAEGTWQVFVDPTSGAPILRRALTRFGRGTVAFDAVERWPGRPRKTYPAPALEVTIGGSGQTTLTDGSISWTGTGMVNVLTSVTGPLVDVDNRAGSAASTLLQIADNGMGLWSPGNDRDLDAQLSAYVHAHLVKEYTRKFAGGLAFLDEQLPVRVNIADECNAYSDGRSINFFRASAQCENTATLADVVYHEFGHSLHAHAIIDGVGFFDGAFSEGLSDYLAATITDDSGMGRGFFKTDVPLRELDPEGREHVWPRDIAELHYTGIIFGGAMWDLRASLINRYGFEPGRDLADRLFYAAVQRAPSIPATLVEILAEDDDDGDLSNGTPNECLIRAAFGVHGLRTLNGDLAADSAVPATTEQTSLPVTLSLVGVDTHCGDTITEAKLEWRPRGSNDSPRAGNAMATADGDVWTAEMPLPDDGDVAQYNMRVKFADGTEMVFPDNRADPYYQVYRGDLMPLYCTDFETDPFAEGWVDDGGGAWQWGVPGGSREHRDPAAAHSGTRVLGTGLAASDGGYPGGRTSWIDTPVIQTGQWSDVRLHYRRWLGVEDGFFDEARIRVNGESAWANLSSHGNNNHTTHHEDRAWVFNDVSLSTRIFEKQVQLRFEIDADDDFELGGWTLDDVCIVANTRSVCGDGEKAYMEQCDNGAANADIPDVCRTNCRTPRCGDGIVDSNEVCDDANQDNLDDCDTTCQIVVPPVDDPGGCCSASTGADPRGAAALALLMMGLLSRRRRSARPAPAR
jgi:cysteine-rich repeat protein